MKHLLLLVAMTASLFISGCSFGSKDYLDLDDDAVIIEKNKKVVISGVYAYFEDDKLVIAGSVKKPLGKPDGIYGGHIDVKLIDSEDQPLAAQNVKFIPISIPRRGNKTARFRAKFDKGITDNPIVHLKYHKGEHPE